MLGGVGGKKTEEGTPVFVNRIFSREIFEEKMVIAFSVLSIPPPFIAQFYLVGIVIVGGKARHGLHRRLTSSEYF